LHCFGPGGAGRTTLLRIIMGDLAPTAAGSVSLGVSGVG
jgi:ABC-type molybdenum transport system ATPase subunit/photorepair protein PhrA